MNIWYFGCRLLWQEDRLQFVTEHGRRYQRRDLNPFAKCRSYILPCLLIAQQPTTPTKTLTLETSTTSATHTVSVPVNSKRYTSAMTMRPGDYYTLIGMTDRRSSMQFEAQKLTGRYLLELSSIEGSKTTIQGLAGISVNEFNYVNGKLY